MTLIQLIDADKPKPYRGSTRMFADLVRFTTTGFVRNIRVFGFPLLPQFLSVSKVCFWLRARLRCVSKVLTPLRSLATFAVRILGVVGEGEGLLSRRVNVEEQNCGRAIQQIQFFYIRKTRDTVCRPGLRHRPTQFPHDLRSKAQKAVERKTQWERPPET
jgi:hypothetical protein